MSEERAEEFIEVMDGWMDFHRACARGVDGGYYRYTNDGSLELTEGGEREFGELRARFSAAIKRIAAAPPSSDEAAV